MSSSRAAVPARREITLPAGRVPLRDLPGPPGRPPSCCSTARRHRRHQLLPVLRRLGQHFRVLAFDHRGHGDGIRSRRTFRLADCADDVVAIADVVGVDTFVPVGYSMGGAVAQPVAASSRTASRRRAVRDGEPLQRHADRAGQLPRPRRVRRDRPGDASGPGAWSSAGSRSAAAATGPWAIEQPSRSDCARSSRPAPRSDASNPTSWLTEVTVPAASS